MGSGQRGQSDEGRFDMTASAIGYPGHAEDFAKLAGFDALGQGAELIGDRLSGRGVEVGDFGHSGIMA